ncbi:MAG: hypothetical protein JXB32_03560 [Deltaproteobacteria bacterium]|nr:hypothetical protein [Deltaproteobacteria bacterium]
MRRWLVPGALCCWLGGCGGASPAAEGTRAGGPGRPTAGAADVAAVEISFVSQFEPSSTTFEVAADGRFTALGTGQDYGHVERAVHESPLPAEVVRELFERLARLAAELDLVEPHAAYEPPSTALTSEQVVVVLADGTRRMAATEGDAGLLLETTAPIQRLLFERTRLPDNSGAQPTADGWLQLGIEVPGGAAVGLERDVPAFTAVLVSDGQWFCSTFAGARPLEGGRTVHETRVASGRVDGATAAELLAAVLGRAHPSAGGWSGEVAGGTVHAFHIDHGWGSPTPAVEPGVLEAWDAQASRLSPACRRP